jgi:hypothetical protein
MSLLMSIFQKLTDYEISSKLRNIIYTIIIYMLIRQTRYVLHKLSFLSPYHHGQQRQIQLRKRMEQDICHGRAFCEKTA